MTLRLRLLRLLTVRLAERWVKTRLHVTGRISSQQFFPPPWFPLIIDQLNNKTTSPSGSVSNLLGTSSTLSWLPQLVHLVEVLLVTNAFDSSSSSAFVGPPCRYPNCNNPVFFDRRADELREWCSDQHMMCVVPTTITLAYPH